MCALILIAGTANAGNGITTRTIGTEQIVGLRGSAVYNGEWGWLTTLSYTNFTNPSEDGAVWGGDLGFAFVTESPYVQPVNAHIMGGWHKTWGGFRLYGGATLGVGTVRVDSKAHNALFINESSQRQFTLTLGATAALLYQWRTIGFGIFASWDYNIFREHDFTVNEKLTLDYQNFYRNPFTIGAMVAINLQSGVTRQDGDRSWRGGAGYLFCLSESSINRTYARLGKTVKQSGKWSAEYGMQFEENFSKSYTAAKLTFEETFLPKGSKSRIRFLAGAAAGFCNVAVASDSFVHANGGWRTGNLWSDQYSMQPGFVLGGMLGIDVRLFGRLHLDASVNYDRCWTSEPYTEGYDVSNVTADPMNLIGIAVGLRYTL